MAGAPNIRNFCSIALTTTTGTTLYTAPTNDSGEPAPYATAIIKEIALANTTAGSINVTINVNGVAILTAVPVSANNTTFLSGLNTMITSGSTITGSASATGVNAIISGVEVQ